jgi:hypothetical protein
MDRQYHGPGMLRTLLSEARSPVVGSCIKADYKPTACTISVLLTAVTPGTP